MKHVHVPVFFIVAISIGILASGCSNSSAPPSNPLPAVPTYGSTLTKVTLISGYPPDTSLLTVDSTPTADPNSSGAKVLKYRELGSNGGIDSTFQSIEPDGNVALRGETWDESGSFYVLPFATTGTISKSYDGPAGPESLIAIHNGAGANYALDGYSYATDSATLLFILGNDTTQYHYTYIPSLGIIARMSDVPSATSGQDPSSYYISSYTPK